MDPQFRLATVVSHLSPAADFDRMVIDPIPSYAMSMHQGLDSDCYRLVLDGQALVVKLLHNELPGAPVLDLAVAAHRAAAALGLAPKIVAEFADLNAAVFVDVSAQYRPALSTDLTDPKVYSATATALRRLHSAPPLGHDRPVSAIFAATFAAIEALRLGQTQAAQLVLPEDGDWLLQVYAQLIAQSDLHQAVPLHGEVLASNILINQDNSIIFVDFDRAANGDPLWDLASLALAAHLEIDQLAPLVAGYGIVASSEVIIRLRQVMALQDIGWGLWGRAAHFLTPRRNIEFFKYGETRLARARGQLLSLGLSAGQT